MMQKAALPSGSSRLPHIANRVLKSAFALSHGSLHKGLGSGNSCHNRSRAHQTAHQKTKGCAFHIHFKLPSANEFSSLICAEKRNLITKSCVFKIFFKNASCYLRSR
jgi:hypothetical protein